MKKTVVILQSNYIPWKGYFDLINSADEFIFYDDVQYTTGDWRNRNKIKTDEGAKWLTIPVGDNIKRTIKEVRFINKDWKRKHFQTLEKYYSKAPFYESSLPLINKLYFNEIETLSEFNQSAIKEISNWLGLTTKFNDSSIYAPKGDKIGRLIDILVKTEATEFLCGPAVKNYLKQESIQEKGIALRYFDYSGYKVYHQLFPPFIHEVSILDLIFNEGEHSIEFLKSYSS
ncbi:WbqC family protein [Sporocytophaga myxococcoides]|uniref:WbqC family protein n=1 Tax=Sporocytophaga myxococcoides TaxID=153721 RepID=UPI000419400B|nr:WbqC family protein [Sporocytophaga myxococcoides]